MTGRFIILGGGTAGWMSALLLQRAFPQSSICVIESEAIGIIGVGEGSTPALKAFMEAVDIPEPKWMMACQATYKSGIRFRDWSTKRGFDSYFHPFFTHFDRDHIKALQFNAKLRIGGKDVHAHPDVFAYSHYLANQKLCPKPPLNFPFEVQYGYHFNAGLLGKFLKQTAIERGIEWRNAHIETVVLNETGDVDYLIDDSGQQHGADFFIDCSGFASCITDKALKTPFYSYADALFNDSAVTLLTDKEEEASTETVSTALKYGWIWKIPLQNRIGNGYVYSSKYCTPEDAEAELRSHLGAKDGACRHLKMKVGRAQSVWNKNSLAVGLSQGFLEPLEATALALVQLTLTRFISYYKAGQGTNRYAAALNKEIAEAFDGVKDYIHLHFLTSDRKDTPYWIDCQKNGQAISPRLRKVLEAWFANGNIDQVLADTGLNKHYKINSWLYLLSGMGIFPPCQNLMAAPAEDYKKVPLEEIESFFKRCTLNHMPQAEAFKLMHNGEGVNEYDETTQDPDHALSRLLGLGFAVSS